MNVLDHMTQDEATVLAGVLVDGGKDAELMEAFGCFWFEHDEALGIGHLMQALHDDGRQIDVISVYERGLVVFEEGAPQIQLLTAICQFIQPRDKTMAILRGGA